MWALYAGSVVFSGDIFWLRSSTVMYWSIPAAIFVSVVTEEADVVHEGHRFGSGKDGVEGG